MVIFLLMYAYVCFMFTYAEQYTTFFSQLYKFMLLGAAITFSLIFMLKSNYHAIIFRAKGQFWDLDLKTESMLISWAITVNALVAAIFCIRKFFWMQSRHGAKIFLIMFIFFTAYQIPNAALNFLWRKGLLSPEVHLWGLAIGMTIAFFTVFVVFLSHTLERSTVIGNLLGITLVAILILTPFLAYPLIEDRKASFREIWAAKLQAGKIDDKNVVFVASSRPPPSLREEPSYSPPLTRGGAGGGAFRDSEPYYTAALKNIPADGVILRADAKGGVYTFPVELAAPAGVTRYSGNAQPARGPADVTHHSGNARTGIPTTDFTRHSDNIHVTGAKTTYIVGIELVELRKYIHPTAAKLVLAQFVVILVIVSLFPLFFRGILLNPMRRLLDGVIAISRGRYGHRIENARSDELGVISRHFDKMAVTIEASTVKLEDTVAQRTAQLTQEKKKSDTLLLNILPVSIADELKEKGHAQPVRIDSATVLFTDFVGFTKISESLTPEEVVAELDKCFSYFDQVTEKYGLEKLKTIGDSFMCAGGVPEANRTHAIDACLAALEIQAFMKQMKEIKHQQGFPYWELRLGINSGPLVAGVVGHKKFAYDVWGDTVNTASRMESSGLAGEINISQSTYELVQKWFVCENRGRVSAKNKGEIDMFLLKRIRPEYCANAEGRVPSEKMKREYVGVRAGRVK